MIVSMLAAVLVATTPPVDTDTGLSLAEAGFALFVHNNDLELEREGACSVDRNTELATCYGLIDGTAVAYEAPRRDEGGWSEFEPVGGSGSGELPYVDPDVLAIIVEEWREDNRPDLDGEELLGIAAKYCSAGGEDPFIVAMLIENEDMSERVLEFLQEICPEMVAIYDAAL